MTKSNLLLTFLCRNYSNRLNLFIASVTANLSVTMVLALIYIYLFAGKRERYIGFWVLGWLLFSFRFVFDLFNAFIPESTGLMIAIHTASLTSGLFLLWGSYAFFGVNLFRGCRVTTPFGGISIEEGFEEWKRVACKVARLLWSWTMKKLSVLLYEKSSNAKKVPQDALFSRGPSPGFSPICL